MFTIKAESDWMRGDVSPTKIELFLQENAMKIIMETRGEPTAEDMNLYEFCSFAMFIFMGILLSCTAKVLYNCLQGVMVEKTYLVVLQ